MSVRHRISSWWNRGKALRHQLAQGPADLAAPGASPFERGSWSLIGGDGAGWPANEHYKVRGLAWHEGRLFTSVSGPATDGPRGEVWSWDGRAWHDVTGDWRGRESFVEHLASHGGDLYAAERNGIWRLRAGKWSNVGAELGAPGRSGGYAFGDYGGRLALTFWGEPGIALYDGSRWERMRAPERGWGEGARTVYCVQEYEGMLYAGTGTGRLSGAGACVWRFDGRAWEKIGGQGAHGSWLEAGIPFVLSLNTYGGRLIATLSRTGATHREASNVWAFDGERWRAVGTSKVPALMARSSILNDTAVFGGRLVAASGDGTHRDAQLWELEADQSWREVGGETFRAPPGGPGGYWIYRLCAAEGALYAGTAGHRGAARVFRFQ